MLFKTFWTVILRRHTRIDHATNLPPSRQQSPEGSHSLRPKLPAGPEQVIGQIRLEGMMTGVRVEGHLSNVNFLIAFVHVHPDMIEPGGHSLRNSDHLAKVMRRIGGPWRGMIGLPGERGPIHRVVPHHRGSVLA